ncbi:MAG: ABC transporter ATP-binding protein [Clostridia bacterium]|nr:ABC transporter ATP-binding protein [Clostridia bacterium]
MIQAVSVSKTFPGVKAIDNLSCSIKKGSIYGLIGSNGSGKSTLLRMLSGIYKPDSGLIKIDDKPVFENIYNKGRTFFLSDDPFVISNYSIKDMARYYKIFYPNWSDERFSKLLDVFKLPPKRPIKNFSKGMQKQAAILLGMSTQPDYYFFDETFDGLDPVMRHLVKRLLMEEIADREVTVIMTSHNLRELEDMCDHIGLLHNGHIIFERDIDDMRLSVHKIQMAFREPPPKEAFDKIEYMHFEQRGSVILMIVRGSEDEVMERMKAFDPTILEMIPLTLEEVFIYEMEVAGYDLEKMQ